MAASSAMLEEVRTFFKALVSRAQFLPVPETGITFEAMDGIAGRNDGLLLLKATNRPDAMDPAALRPGRFDCQVYVGLPDAQARVDILKKREDGLPTDPAVDLDGLGLRVEGYSAADLSSICEDAA